MIYYHPAFIFGAFLAVWGVIAATLERRSARRAAEREKALWSKLRG